MKNRFMKSLMLFAVVLIGNGCHGDSDNLMWIPPHEGITSTLTVNTISSLSTSTTTSVYSGKKNSNPHMTGSVSSGLNRIFLSVAHEDTNGMPSDYLYSFIIEGTGVDTYPTSSNTGMSYIDMNAGDTYSSTSGTISITSVGNTGKPIIGSFDTVVESSPTNTARMWGTFSIERQ